MNTDENAINNFANVLRNYHMQRTVSLYSENQSSGNSGGETYEIKDVISGVAKQLKAIQNADSFKKRPSGKGIPNFVKKSTFLPIHMVPVEQLPKEIPSHKFETQCVLDTQLMNIIDNAEAIMDAEKGITQEFDTTFYHIDSENCNDKSMDGEILSTSQNNSNAIKNSVNVVDNNKFQSQDQLDYHLDRDETNNQLDHCIMPDNKALKHYAEKGMTQEFNTTFCHKDLHENIKEKNECHANQENNVYNIQGKNMKNVNILPENFSKKECVIIAETKNEQNDLFVNKLSLTEPKAIADIISIREFVPKTYTNGKSIDVCDNFETQLKVNFDRCEDDNDSQNKEPIFKVEEPSSPILNKIRPKVKSNTPSPLIFELESFEKFETLAFPVMENHDFETAKRVINSQILNRELFIHTHAETVLSDRDKGIQKSSLILNHNIKSDSLNVRCTDSHPHLKEDSMLFSSDEENDVQKYFEDLPLTCTLQNIQNSCNNDPCILDKNMYVGFQTASNKSIQISIDSYCKAKSIFDNYDNIEEQSLSETNVEATMAIKNINELDNVNMYNATNKNDNDQAHVKSDNSVTYNISQNNSNVFEHKDTICNEDKIIQQQISTPHKDVRPLSTKKAKYDSIESNFTEHLKIDEHVLKEFDKDLTPDIIFENKIYKLSEDDIMNSDKVSHSKNKIDNKSELDLNVMKPINNDFVGFRTANNKMIKISTEALIKTKNIFENIDIDDNLPRKNERQSFKTPNLKPSSLHRSKSGKNINNFNENNKTLAEKPLYPVCITELNAFKGFTTASNKSVKIPESALVKSKNIFHDTDIENNVEENVFKISASVNNSVFQGFKTANNKYIPVTMKQLAKSKELFQDIFDTKTLSAEFSNFRNESLALIDDSRTEKPKVQLQAFQTASNKSVQISKEALFETKNIFQDIDIDDRKINGHFDYIAKQKQPYLIGSGHQNAIHQGFKTALNKPVVISAQALAKSKKLLQAIDNEKSNLVNDSDNILLEEKQPYPTANIHQNAVCRGFKTAANKPVGISAEAFKISKTLLQDIDNKESNIVNDSDNIFKEKQPYPIAHIAQNTASCLGFKTAADRPVGISAEALTKSKKIFQDIDNNENYILKYDSDNILKEKQPYPIGHTSHNAGIYQGFKTAGNKRVGISAEALAKSKKIFQDIDVKEINIVNNFDNMLKENQPYSITHTSHNANIWQGFKTGGNKPVEISALVKSKKIFQDIDNKESNIVNDSDEIFKEKQVETSGVVVKSKNTFENMDNDCKKNKEYDEVIEKQPEIVQRRQNFIGFHIASKEEVIVSENALLKSRQVLQKTGSDLKIENHSFKYPIDKSVCKFGFQTGNNTQINISEEALRKSRNLFSDLNESIKANLGPKLKEPDDVISENVILEDFNTEIIKDFEETVNTEDFFKNETPKSKRSGSPILSCPKSNKRKKFETPIITKKFVAPIKTQSIIKTDTTNVYCFNENYKKIKKSNLKDVNEIEKLSKTKTIDPYILNLRFDTLLDFEFINDRNDIDNDKWTTDKIKGCFTDSVNKRIIPDGWVDNHMKMIIWKLVSYEIRFPGVMKNVCSVKNILEQLKYRYKRELYNVERPVLRKILEKDEVSSKMMILCVAGLFVDGVSICSGGRMMDSPIATVEEGQLQGKLVHSPNGKAFYSFQGIPYAKPPIGSLRFRAPQPPEPWEGIRDATTEGNSSAQIDFLANGQYVGDENCLFLNVYTPTLDGEFLPVMVYIHGGGFRWGSSSTYHYGADYLVEKDVVIVTINYRCGALGFLSLNTPEVPGNAGMKDMVQALRWVKQNIQNFGGNSRNLTIFGESAGGVSVSLLTASPLSKDLISKAIIQSGTALNSWATQNNPLENARILASDLGCESTDLNEIFEYLSTTPVRDLVEAAERMKPTEAFAESGKTFFGPVVEKEFAGVEAFLTEAFISVLTSGRVADVPIMIGSNALEFTYDPLSDDLQTFIPAELNIERNTPESLAIADDIKKLYFTENPTVDKYKLLSDFLINIGTHRYVQYLLNVTNKPIYYYKFGYVGEINISKDIFKSVSLNYAGHFDEIGYLFKNEVTKDVEPTPQDIKTRERMLRLWTNFAKTGNPTPDENHYLTITWLPATKDKVYYLNINNELSMEMDPDKEKMEFWDRLYSKYFKIWDHPVTNDVVIPKSEPISPKSEPISPQSEPISPQSEPISPKNESISPKDEPIIVATSPVIVEETIITTVTTVVNEKGEEKSNTEVFVDVQDSTGQHYQESFNDLKGNLEQNFDRIQDKLAQIPGNLTQVPDNIPQIPDNIAQVPDNIPQIPDNIAQVPDNFPQVQQNLKNETVFVVDNPIKPDVIITGHSVIDDFPEKLVNIVKLQEKFSNNQNGGEEHKLNGNFDKKPRPSNEIKMVQNSNINPKDVIRANDPPEDDLPKNIGVNKFVNFFESLGGKK